MPRTLVLGIFTNFREILQNQRRRIGVAKSKRKMCGTRLLRLEETPAKLSRGV